MTAIVRALTRLAGAAPPRPSLEPERLIAAAARAAGEDAGPLADPGLAEALAALTASLEAEAALTPFGRRAAAADLTRTLATLAVLAARERDDPAIPARPLPPPIVVAGLPRSGTTFLHGLLAEDPAHRAPRIWETLYPYPRAAGLAAGRRRAQLELGAFALLSPGVRRLHPVAADAPQECIEITSQVVRSPRFDDVYRAPSYRAWLERAGFDEGYRHLARFLRHLQGPGDRPRRWVLKSPEHVFSADALARAFPGAALVLVHRDPGRVLASAARLTEAFRAPFTDAIDRREIGRRVADHWQEGMRRMVALADDPAFPLRVAHVRYRALVADPVGTVAAVYRALGLALSDGARAAIAASAARAPRGGYGVNRYRPEDYGLDPDRERERAAAYVERFGVGASA